MHRNAHHRAQLMFRKAQGELSWNSPGRDDPSAFKNPLTYYLVVGCIETDVGALEAETSHGFIMGDRRGGFEISLGATQQQEERDAFPELDAGGILTSLQVRSPGGFANLVAHGGLYLRRTRFPTQEGRETLVACGILRAGPDLPERRIFELAGQGSTMRVTKSRDVPEAFAMGSTVTTALGLPIWGFGEETRGFYSTLHLDLLDRMKEYQALKAVPDRSAEQESRMSDLWKGGLKWLMGHRDERFERWQQCARDLGTPIDIPPDSYLTAAEKAAQDAACTAAMKVMFEEENAYTPRSP